MAYIAQSDNGTAFVRNSFQVIEATPSAGGGGITAPASGQGFPFLYLFILSFLIERILS